MKRRTGTIVPALFLLALLIASCGGERSVASKSAAAYRDARAKGVEVGGGHEHGGHAAETASTAPADHSAHASMDHAAAAGGATTDHTGHGAAMTAADHAAMGHTSGGGSTDHAAHRPTGAAGDHAQHGSTSAAAATHDGHTASPSAHAGMAHGATGTAAAEHAQHTQQASGGAQLDHSQHATAPSPVTAPRSTAETQSLQPTSTLRRDEFDAPASVAVSEASKATQGGGHEGHTMRGITPGEDHENPPTPMPATRDRTTTGASAVDHSQHGSAGGSQQPASTAALYTCPMHPEVTSGQPGRCPKCGMALVKKN